MAKPEEAYKELTGCNLDSDQLERILRIARVLKLHLNDAIWALVIAFEFYQHTFAQLNKSYVLWSKIQTITMIVCTAILVWRMG